MNQVFNFRSREEAKLVRQGLKILRDSCACGPDYTNYEPYGRWSRKEFQPTILAFDMVFPVAGVLDLVVCENLDVPMAQRLD
jgi:hypothetical protein